ncbi:MAG: M20/M25/M40 family metallo-hydrolase, partial [Halobacteriales archaeon]|nr:M20/M25/M40 family metallo-hydrolase [Halobacteriales archaeon]
MSEEAFAVIDDRLEEYRSTLFELLRIPGVSATGDRLEETADAVEDILDRCGFDTTQIDTTGAPIVYGEVGVDPDRPTILFYGHYDVQPAGDPQEWDSPPFDPTIRDGSIVARGAGDNKGQVLAHAFAVDALEESMGELPVGVKVIVEGEEESGSGGLRSYLADEPERLACDLIYVSDGPMHRSRRPTLIYGNRGILAFELTIEAATTDLHSGNFGGPVPNAGNRMVSLVASMVGPDGEIRLDGVADDVSVTEAMRAAARAIPVDAEGLKADVGIDAFTVPDEDYYERLLVTPNASVN